MDSPETEITCPKCGFKELALPIATGENPGLAIKYNTVASNDPCAICGSRTDPEVGPELFLAENAALVCYDCGRKFEPYLVEMLLAWRKKAHKPATEGIQSAIASLSAIAKKLLYEGEESLNSEVLGAVDNLSTEWRHYLSEQAGLTPEPSEEEEF